MATIKIFPWAKNWSGLLTAVLIISATHAALGADEPPDEPVRLKKKPTTAEAAVEAGWLTSLKQGYRQAMAEQKPMLVVVSRETLPAARRLVRELQQPAFAKALAQWVVVHLDAGRPASEAESLDVKEPPALRALTSGGRAAAAYDGYLAAEELTDWLDASYKAATAPADEALTSTGKPDAATIEKLAAFLGDRSPAVREAAVRRLLPYPDVAAAAALGVLREGPLGAKLAAVELFEAWQAPAAECDPWRKETLTAERLAALEEWAATAKETAGARELNAEQIAGAQQAIAAMLTARPGEVEALRERLARHGQALMPEVYAQLKAASTDEQRRRLQTLRYRLAASDALALRWPGGLVRLAAVELAQRQQAAVELADLATAADQPLLLELFSDPEPAVREIALRGLRRAGGKEATTALLKLLEDPSLNVRAAVLNQLLEEPPSGIAGPIRDYVERETDPDLIGHGIRLVRAVGGKPAVGCMIKLLEHKSWQVRAEAAEALGKLKGSLESRSGDQELTIESHVALLKLLADEDAFVVSRAVAGLEGIDMVVAVDPLIAAAQQHPELSAQVFKILLGGGRYSSRGENPMRAKALPRVREFLEHKDPRVRAAAITGLATGSNTFALADLFDMLSDPDPAPRIAAARQLFKLQDQREPDDPFAFGRRSTRRGAARVVAVAEVEDRWAATAADLARWWEETVRSFVPWLSVGLPAPEPGPTAFPVEIPGLAAPGEVTATVDPPATLLGILARAAADGYGDIFRHVRQGAAKRRFVAPLLKMLKSDSTEEAVAAAMALAALGQDKLALPALLRIVARQPDLLQLTSNVLKHLPWDQRVRAFHEFLKIAKEEELRVVVIGNMQEAADRRLAALFWPLLEAEKTTDQEATALTQGIRCAFCGNRYSSDIAPRLRAALVADARPRVESGPARKRLAALWLLALADVDTAAEVAAAMIDDKTLAAEARRDVLRLLLFSLPEKEAGQRAVAELQGSEPLRRKTALLALVAGASAVLHQDDAPTYLYLPSRESDAISSRSGEPIVPEPPAGVKADDIRPLLNDDDPKTAAAAGYLLALLSDDAGLEKLLAYWRKNRDDAQDRLVYRAIAALDAGDRLPELETIYAGVKEGYHLSEFYWTIRVMTGDKLLAFRKRIRDEVGMSRLR